VKPRVLIVRFSSLGDVVMATAAARYLKAQGAEVVFATKAAFAPLLAGQDCIDEVWALEDGGLRGLARRAKAGGVTGLLDLHGNLRSRALGWFCGLPLVRWEAGTLNRRLRVLFPKRKQKDLPPVAQRYVEAAARLLGREAAATLPQLRVEGASRLWAEDWLAGQGHQGLPLLAVAPGAAWASKRWELDRLAAALDAVTGARVVLVGSRGERTLCEELAAKLAEKPFMAAGETGDLRLLLALLGQCKAFLGHDSGPMHLAEGLGLPCTVLFGPTVEAFGFYPQGPGHKVFERDLDCRPCSVHGTPHCPLGHHHCLKTIEPAEVAAHLNQVLAA
jgi:heptosyltransferase-2